MMSRVHWDLKVYVWDLCSGDGTNNNGSMLEQHSNT